MKSFTAVLIGGLLWLGLSSSAEAQVAWVTYYQPTTVFSPAIVSPAPVVQTAFYAPAPTVAVAPAPTLTYQPVARVQTRFRPILGGTVSRVRYGYAPVLVQPTPVVMAW
jgi:hypothetical protein